MGVPQNRSRAVVVGAGMAGLTVARVLADRFGEVIVLDRDALPDGGVPRRGAPQGYQPHTLLAAGQRALEALFPGLRDELVAAGAAAFDTGHDLRLYRYGMLWPRLSIGLELITSSRPLLEYLARRRVATLANVTIRDRTAVSALDGSGGQVTGVVLDDGERLASDLVVDCSGRGSRSDRWLSRLGFPTPAVAEVKVGVGYVSRFVRRSPGDLPDGSALLILPTPPHERRIGLVLPVERDLWQVSVGGWHGEYPSGDEEAFRRHADSLPHSGVADVLARGEAVSGLRTHQFPSSRLRRFQDLRELPGGYVCVGDAICSFNPVYGQGMTVAALQALALGRVLDRHPGCPPQLTRAFYRSAARVITTPWRFAVGADFAFPETAGPKPPAINLLNRYSRRIQLAAQTSVEVRRTFSAVQHLVASPATLFSPPMIARVARSNHRHGAAAAG